jgi:hypothetical protein
VYKTADNINGRLHGTEESRLPKVFANDKVVGVLLKTKANVEDVDSRQLREEAGVGNVKTVGGVKGEILLDEGYGRGAPGAGGGGVGGGGKECTPRKGWLSILANARPGEET